MPASALLCNVAAMRESQGRSQDWEGLGKQVVAQESRNTIHSLDTAASCSVCDFEHFSSIVDAQCAATLTRSAQREA
ncbi:hypothetical protein EJ03DRAFT_31171 [Teratosphaeria nubilosa]|uniref:Uncharacterized protein n=1 Tax=Teratosphaeria nubilosa TaxID=161662 RepID=A0A6G1LG48_9PEZI|nr:hypothetical protein EJ03DRAFT_31171 [Teratosphaeria nubilosa]